MKIILLVRLGRTSKMIFFPFLHTYTWIDENHFAGPSRSNQQNDFLSFPAHIYVYDENRFAGSIDWDQQNDFSILAYTQLSENRFAGPS